MPDKKTDNTPIVLTFTIDPAFKLIVQGERAMAVSVVARRGDVGQLSQFDMSNWKTDLPAEVDRLMRLLLGGTLALPDFPHMGQSAPVLEKPALSEESPEGDEEPSQVEDEATLEPEPETSMNEDEDYDITLFSIEPNVQPSTSSLTLF